MKNNDKILLRGGGLYVCIGLLLAWCLIGSYNNVGFVKAIFPGDPQRILQAHIDFLLMGALILGIAATRVPLAWHAKWAMVIGAFTNSSLFLAFAIFPHTNPGSEAFVPDSLANHIFHYSARISFIITTYGFGGAGIGLFRSTLSKK